MSKSTDKLAFALGSPEPVSRQYFRTVFDHLYVTDAVPAGHTLDIIDEHRRSTAINLEALSICDFEFGERHMVHSCAPYLGLLPRSGFPTAVLFGARTPFLLRELSVAVRSHRPAALLTITGQPRFPLLPHRVRVQAKDVALLQAIANATKVPLLDQPPAVLLLSHSYSVEDYAASLPWSTGQPDLNWPRDDFDTPSLRFQPQPRPDASLQLIRYRHPQQAHRRVYYLVDGDRAAPTDPTWGRYCVLQRANRNVLTYDDHIGVLLLPAFVPAPRLLARALVSCSGIAPQEAPSSGAEPMRAFVQVPPTLAAAFARKLGQALLPVRLATSLRDAND